MAWRTRRVPKPRPFICLKTSSSMLSRLTVMRRNPASLSPWACWASRYPLVVRVTSVIPSMAATWEMSSGRSVRNSGSPPVMRALETPNSENKRVSLAISSKVRISSRGRNS